MTCKPLALAAVVAAALFAPAARAAIVPGQVIDGPNNLVQKFSDVDLLPDGTGALAYVKKVGMPSQEHIFVSLFTGGAWTSPEDVKTTAECPCGQAHVAAGNGGRVVVTFVDVKTNLQSAGKQKGGGPFQLLPVDVGGGIQNDDVDMDPVSGVAYAIDDIGPGMLHVRASRLVTTTWAPVTTGTLGNLLDSNSTPGTAGGPDSVNGARIAVDSSGNAVAVWPEGGPTDRHVYTRRLTGATAGAPV